MWEARIPTLHTLVVDHILRFDATSYVYFMKHIIIIIIIMGPHLS